MLLIDPIRYYQLCKLAWQSLNEQAILYSIIDILILMVLMLTAALCFYVRQYNQQREDIKDYKQIIKEDCK